MQVKGEPFLRKLNGEFTEQELAEILRIMENQYLSRDCRTEVFTYFDDSTGRYIAAYQTSPDTRQEPGNNSNLLRILNECFTPIAIKTFDVEPDEKN